MLLSLAILLIALLAWQLPYGNRLLLKTGDVAPFTVVAPRRISFESQVLTERARERAAQQVPDQYDISEGTVRREQVALARTLLSQIAAIRNHREDTLAQQTDELLELAELNLNAETAVQILSLSNEEWQQVVGTVPLALDRVMRDEIRESTLSQAKRRVPLLISGELDEASSDVAIALTQSLIRSNSTLNEQRTQDLRNEARALVPVQFATLTAGETVIRSGDKATPEQAEALAVLNDLQSEWDFWTLVRSIVFVLVLVTIVIGALYRLRPAVFSSQRELALLVVVAVVWLLAAKFMMVNHPWLPYFYPLAAFGILISVLCDLRVAVVFIVALTIILLYMLPENAPVAVYQMLGALAGVLLVGRAERLNAFLWAGLAVAASNLAVMVAFHAPFEEYSSTMMIELVMVVFLHGGLSAAIALIGYFVLGNVFGITTPLQLTELSRPTHPLLRQLLLKASGTYHHTILVSNLAERGAAAIGADAMLVRVGAYYHDIGKTVRPYFFAENIMDGSSPHEKLEPFTSAQIIISHVKDGVDLAQKYKLPERIQDFIREHHGRSLVKYFYLQALQQAEPGEMIGEEDFRYPGPNPRTRETAILMLADTCEAAVRAVRPGSREELEALVNRLIDERVANNELNDSDLTFHELQTIKEVFLQVLQGVHHPRIKYPDATQAERTGASTGPIGGERRDGEAQRTSPREIGGVEESLVSRSPTTTPAAEG
ncbi:MAG: HDIG domain-containing protein [Caldilineaceae bacterium]|nr:HDIG domain-containing protein [Caldilineaceae bacterium]